MFATNANKENVKMIEIKLSQGAKPGERSKRAAGEASKTQLVYRREYEPLLTPSHLRTFFARRSTRRDFACGENHPGHCGRARFGRWALDEGLREPSVPQCVQLALGLAEFR